MKYRLKKKCKMSSSFQKGSQKLFIVMKTKRKFKNGSTKYSLFEKKHLLGEEKWKVHSELSTRYVK